MEGKDGNYKFDISNGQVTGESRVVGSHTVSVHIPIGATFSVGSGSVTETITSARGAQTLNFTADASDATLYHLTSSSTVFAAATSGAIGFTIANGTVTAMTVSDTHGNHTGTHTVPISATTSFSVGADGSVTRTEIEGHAIETTVYKLAGASGLYAAVSETETFIQSGGSSTVLDVEAHDRAKFTIDASGTVTGIARVLADGSTKTVTPGASTTYSQLAAGYVLEVQTHGSHTSYEVYHDGNGDGIYTEVAHGSGATVDLVGLQAQISSTINAVL